MNKLSWKKEWFFGGETKDTSIDDYVIAYTCGEKRIECEYSFSSFSNRWYLYNELSFNTLKEAKTYAENN